MSEIRTYAVVLIHHPTDGDEPHVVATWTEAENAVAAVETILASDHIRGYDPGDFQQVVTVAGATMDSVDVAGPTDAWWPS